MVNKVVAASSSQLPGVGTIFPTPPSYLQWLVAPVRMGIDWMWEVTILQPGSEKSAALCIAIASLGVFPTWINIAAALFGVAVLFFSLKQRELEKRETLLQLQMTKGTFEEERARFRLDVEQEQSAKRRVELQIADMRDQGEHQAAEAAVVRQQVYAMQQQVLEHQERASLMDEGRQMLSQQLETARSNLSQAEEANQKLNLLLLELEAQLQGAEERGVQSVTQVREQEGRLTAIFEKFHELCNGIEKGDATLDWIINEQLTAYEEDMQKHMDLVKGVIDDLPSTDCRRIPLVSILTILQQRQDTTAPFVEVFKLFCSLVERKDGVAS